MFKKNFIIVFLITGLVYTGCNSPIYEIVEVEEPIEIKEEPKQEIPPVSDIKEDTKPSENKFSEKNVISKSYIIQIGAFSDEKNADRYFDKAKQKFDGMDLSVKNIEGLYKIRLAGFNSRDEAISFLQKTKDAGFNDSFVVELTLIKTENK